MPTENSIDVHIESSIARVTICNAAKLNTLNRSLMDRFVSAIHQLPAVRVVVLRGEGERAFVGGADIREMADLDQPRAPEFIRQVHRCCAVIRDLPVPVIARCAGYTLGAGLELAAACDLRIAAETAHFGMPEVKVGIPSVVEAALLPKLIGWGRARRLLLLGETITAQVAESWGLVEKVVPENQLDSAIHEWIETILQNGDHAVRIQKKLIRKWEDMTLSAAIEAGIDAFESAYTTDEPRQKMREFLSRKR